MTFGAFAVLQIKAIGAQFEASPYKTQYIKPWIFITSGYSLLNAARQGSAQSNLPIPDLEPKRQINLFHTGPTNQT
jgi:hypothetical protein